MAADVSATRVAGESVAAPSRRRRSRSRRAVESNAQRRRLRLFYFSLASLWGFLPAVYEASAELSGRARSHVGLCKAPDRGNVDRPVGRPVCYGRTRNCRTTSPVRARGSGGGNRGQALQTTG